MHIIASYKKASYKNSYYILLWKCRKLMKQKFTEPQLIMWMQV